MRLASSPATLAALVFAVAALLVQSVADADASARPGVYRGTTAERAGVAIHVSRGRVTLLRVTVRRYACEVLGEIGPLALRVAPGASIGHDGSFSFRGGELAERWIVRGRFLRRGRLSGALRVRGQAGIGHRCVSRRIAFSARREGARR
ncbi:MAG: hypothetical protein LT070_04695 [Solirubrobacteraceae bacterium]|nr:hypothetical protein [Solirubrobacteraceae bacterium]